MSEAIFNYTAPGLSEDSMEITCRNDTVNISVENPWAGSTETGFGATCYIHMTVDKAHEVGRFLLSLK